MVEPSAWIAHEFRVRPSDIARVLPSDTLIEFIKCLIESMDPRDAGVIKRWMISCGGSEE